MVEGSRKVETKIELALRWQGGDAGLSCRSWSPERSPTKRHARQKSFRRGREGEHGFEAKAWMEEKPNSAKRTRAPGRIGEEPYFALGSRPQTNI